jgi:hypothetical protein
VCVEVRHLLFCNLFNLRLGERTDLSRVWLAAPLLFAERFEDERDTGGVLRTKCTSGPHRLRSLQAPVAAHLFRCLVELLDEFADVDAGRAQAPDP